MPKASNLYRRGAIYWWRRRLVLAISGNLTITWSLSLRTADLRTARARGAAMTVLSEGLRMTVQQRIVAGEIGPAEARQIMAAEARRYCQTLVRVDASMVGASASLCVSPQRSLVVLEQYWSGVERGGLMAYPDHDYADANWPELTDAEKTELRDVLKRYPTHSALVADAVARLEAADIALTQANIDVAMRLMIRARAQAARMALADPLSALLDEDRTLPPVVAPEGAAPPEPMASATWTEPKHRPVMKQASLPDPFIGVDEDKLVILNMTPVELAQELIDKRYGFLDHRQGGKREPSLGKGETRRQILCAARLLQQSVQPGTPFSLITAEQVKTFDGYLDGIPLSFGKAPKDHSLDLRLADVVQATTARIADGQDPLTADDVGLSIPTSNKHFRYLQRLRDLVEKLCPGLPKVSYSDYCQPDLKGARDARVEYSAEQGQAIFSLPPWTGCIGVENRLQHGASVIHDALYWVLLLVWYTGARREEICSLLLSNIREDLGYQFIEIAAGKTVNAVRRIPICAELRRLGFLEFVHDMREAGEIRLFPDIEPGRTKGKLGDVFYKLWWIYLKPMVPGLVRGQAMHSCRHTVSTELKDLGVFPEFRNDLMGWAGGSGVGESRYAKTARLRRLQELVDMIPVVTGHLPTANPSTITLLPKELRQPRPTRPMAN